jgi:hypothetical protein
MVRVLNINKGVNINSSKECPKGFSLDKLPEKELDCYDEKMIPCHRFWVCDIASKASKTSGVRKDVEV